MLLSDDDCQPSTNDGDGFAFLQNKGDFNGMDTDEFSLIDEIFLANELNASIPSSSPTLGDSPIFRDTGDDAMDALKTTIDEGKPFESFEKQITITVPQPPPLDTDAIAIGGGLFQGEFSCICHVLPLHISSNRVFVVFSPHQRHNRSHKHSTSIVDIAAGRWRQWLQHIRRRWGLFARHLEQWNELSTNSATFIHSPYAMFCLSDHYLAYIQFFIFVFFFCSFHLLIDFDQIILRKLGGMHAVDGIYW